MTVRQLIKRLIEYPMGWDVIFEGRDVNVVRELCDRDGNWSYVQLDDTEIKDDER